MTKIKTTSIDLNKAKDKNLFKNINWQLATNEESEEVGEKVKKYKKYN